MGRLECLVVALAVLFAGAPANAQTKLQSAAGVDWPDFLGPNRDSQSPEKGLLTKWPAEGPPIVWKRELGTGYATCVIKKGRLYLFDRDRDHARLVALASETGKEVWKFEYKTEYDDLLGYDNGPRCSPVVDDERVYIFGPEGMLHALSVTTGKPVWKKDTKAEFGVVQNFFGVGSTPLLEGDLLITMVGGSPKDSPPNVYGGGVVGNGSAIVALDRRTGEVRYKISDELASYSSPVCATIGGRRWCFALCRGGLLAFEPKSGKIDFHFPHRASLLESVNASNPVVIGERVFISECYGVGSALLKVKPGGYDVVWKDGRVRDKAMMLHWNTAIHRDGFLYGSSGRHTSTAELRCIELATGKVQWRKPGLTLSSLLYFDGHFVCLSEDGVLRLLAVDPREYRELGAVELTDRGETLLKYPAWAAPVLSHGLLYVRGKDQMVCLDLRKK